MSRFHVTYFYHATGMENGPDRRDYGHVEAATPEEAKRVVAKREVKPQPKWGTIQELEDWLYGCLSAREE